jgi:DNA topoisomerase-1
VRTARGFRYVDAHGRPVRHAQTLKRIRSLVIPPAWTDVWICRKPNGHLQATGRDQRGRKQYRYHPKWRLTRDRNKFDQLLDFGQTLPRIRSRVARDLRRRGLPRDKVLATILRLLETTLIRVGNEEYSRENGSFGLTTLRDRHAKDARGRVLFEFRGKSGKPHSIPVADQRLSRIVRRCRELPGQTLFQYRDERGRRHAVNSTHVNGYLQDITGRAFTAKDFRTWAGTVLAWSALSSMNSNAQRHRATSIAEAVAAVAGCLGNTAAVCRKCYVHPAIIDAFQAGKVRFIRRSSNGASRHLRVAEQAVLRLLRSANTT